MNKRLFLVRHGDAPSVSENDFDRILSKNGVLEIKQASNFLKDYKIDFFLCSCAPRAIQTFENLDIPDKENIVLFSDIIYKNDVDNILNLISSVDDQYNSLCIVGHNPTITDLTNLLLKSSTVQYFNTGQVAILDLDLESWSEIYFSDASLSSNFTPYV
jgi:phosphohistidine phosphatase